ncbi:FtsX-like permease family protein [Micromonospora viridifaciens]|uniref:FtsX-like permease family protein n=1 Tax=Micromonospora viridifaciens TaxID=1881 RepID=A0A1C5A095_MICVI|nr:ABC transporter permease [Micromonospora viridifaciens]SCF38637.1 FtsX-like permease family protein [Micromonospora viridifaciens]
MTASEIRRPGGRLRAGLGDLLMGARMAFTGGREGWTRTVLTALGVGVGVAMLLLAAAVPGAIDARHDRTAARSDTGEQPEVSAAADTLLVAPVDTVFRGRFVRGRIVHQEGPDAPMPPGLAAFPRDGEAVVSPALRALLDSPDGPLLAPRLGGARVTGTIGPEGLAGPDELAFYLGRDTMPPDNTMRLIRFGNDFAGEELGPVLWLLVVVVFVVLLLPIVVFLGAAVRFGGEQRDRRLAALRLLGADTGMVRRIAAAEAGTAALFGLAVGALLFLAGRQLAPLVSLYDISVFPGDLRPAPWLAALVALAVPLLAAGVALLALRGVLVTPLGVSRRATPARRRLWWRLLPPAAGLALLHPLVDVRAARSDTALAQVTAGTVLLLAGTVALLPWLVDVLVRRLRGGPPPWQLAIRRLQLDSAASARLVSGVAVAVAGTIGLQMLVAGVQDEFRETTGQDPTRAQLSVSLYNVPEPGKALAQVAVIPGVKRSVGTVYLTASPHTSPAGRGRESGLRGQGDDESETPIVEVRVGDCAALAEYGDLGSCADGDVFLTWPNDPISGIGPNARLNLGGGTETWRVPAAARTVPVRDDPMGMRHQGLLVTPGAMPSLPPQVSAQALLSLDPRDPDAAERVRAEVAGLDLFASVDAPTRIRESSQFANVRRGLLAGAVVTLLLIGVSMLVGVLEQLRERRRLLAALVAVGTPRSALGWSVLGQTGVPVLAGLVLATGTGVAMGAALLKLVGAQVVVSWPVVALGVGLGAAVVLLVTVASLPVLWRLTRPDGLRFE